jgi:DNA-binding NarL/FixJ family response regulator
MIRVVVADDNPALRLGIRSCLGTCDDIEVVAEADDGDVALEMVERHRPDVLVLDVRMPRVDGITVLERLDRTHPIAVLMLTNSDDPAVVHAALSRGANGYLVYPQKDVEEIAHAVRQVAAGETVLASRAATQLLSLLPAPGATATGPTTPTDPAGLTQRFQLSPREVDVLDLLVRGCNNAEIAGQLFVAEKTVKNHLNRIFAKLHASSRAEAMAIWRGDREPA